VADDDIGHLQNVMHLVVTALVVIFSLTALILSIIGARK
jgi:multisubunit Na+/H+ antiporter MnhC subunit